MRRPEYTDAFYAGLLVWLHPPSKAASAPILLYQIWAFVAPALYKHERKLVIPLLVSSSLLFYIGMAFAYFVVFPLAFGFLTSQS